MVIFWPKKWKRYGNVLNPCLGPPQGGLGGGPGRVHSGTSARKFDLVLGNPTRIRVFRWFHRVLAEIHEKSRNLTKISTKRYELLDSASFGHILARFGVRFGQIWSDLGPGTLQTRKFVFFKENTAKPVCSGGFAKKRCFSQKKAYQMGLIGFF